MGYKTTLLAYSRRPIVGHDRRASKKKGYAKAHPRDTQKETNILWENPNLKGRILNSALKNGLAPDKAGTNFIQNLKIRLERQGRSHVEGGIIAIGAQDRLKSQALGQVR